MPTFEVFTPSPWSKDISNPRPAPRYFAWNCLLSSWKKNMFLHPACNIGTALKLICLLFTLVNFNLFLLLSIKQHQSTPNRSIGCHPKWVLLAIADCYTKLNLFLVMKITDQKIILHN